MNGEKVELKCNCLKSAYAQLDELAGEFDYELDGRRSLRILG